MSYSFSVRAATKDEVKTKIAEQMREVVDNQPVHKADADNALAAAHSFIDTLSDPTEGTVIAVSISGSLTWNGMDDERKFTSASVSISASLQIA